MDSASQPLLDALDHFCIQADGDPEFARDFYAASTPEEMVALAVDAGILIDADDFRALLRSGSTEHWECVGRTVTTRSFISNGFFASDPSERPTEQAVRSVGRWVCRQVALMTMVPSFEGWFIGLLA